MVHSHPIQELQVQEMREQREDAENESIHCAWDHPKNRQVANHEYNRRNHRPADVVAAVALDQKRERDRRISFVRRDGIFSNVNFGVRRQQLPLIIFLGSEGDEFDLIGAVVHFLAGLHPRAEGE